MWSDVLFALYLRAVSMTFGRRDSVTCLCTLWSWKKLNASFKINCNVNKIGRKATDIKFSFTAPSCIETAILISGLFYPDIKHNSKVSGFTRSFFYEYRASSQRAWWFINFGSESGAIWLLTWALKIHLNVRITFPFYPQLNKNFKSHFLLSSQ